MHSTVPAGKSLGRRQFERDVPRLKSPEAQLGICPACADQVAVPFLDEETQPLATVAWPKTSEEARMMKKLPLAFVRCVNCGHVYNSKFHYEEVPYSDKPNLMFNQGTGWSKHINRVCNLLLEYLPPDPVVVEIGCGTGHLLQALAKQHPNGRYIGFDPNVEFQKVGSVEFRGELFNPSQHIAELSPDILVSRHVLEHLMNPLGFLQTIAVASNWTRSTVRLYTEVPCIDRALETGRIVDFYYEHNSHFTTNSFMSMFRRSGGTVEMLVHNYNHEVLSGLVSFGSEHRTIDIAHAAGSHREAARRAKLNVGQQLSELFESGSRVVIWGGTGKAAAFMNYFNVDAERFPLVVDSDKSKWGTFVPGTGQQIVSRDELLSNPVDIVIIPMQWRARDVAEEMEGAGISCREILIEHEGRLIDFNKDVHPY
ncbi:MAG: methyltransferase domain-containing protein [Planctomycetales bacterium]|nr:methyltransferase domain-containing protein [Planctomycetales bacterium]